MSWRWWTEVLFILFYISLSSLHFLGLSRGKFYFYYFFLIITKTSGNFYFQNFIFILKILSIFIIYHLKNFIIIKIMIRWIRRIYLFFFLIIFCIIESIYINIIFLFNLAYHLINYFLQLQSPWFNFMWKVYDKWFFFATSLPIYHYLFGQYFNIIKLYNLYAQHYKIFRKYENLPRDKSSEVTFPSNKMSFELDSALVSQNLILWSKWPLIIVEPAPSEVTRSLQLEPANFVSIPVNKQD